MIDTLLVIALVLVIIALAIFILPRLFVFLSLVVVGLGAIVVGLVKEFRRSRKVRRANKGKVKCEALIKGALNAKDRIYCDQIAVYKCPNGYSCRDHTDKLQSYSVRFQHPLDFAKAEIEAEREQRREVERQRRRW